MSGHCNVLGKVWTFNLWTYLFGGWPFDKCLIFVFYFSNNGSSIIFYFNLLLFVACNSPKSFITVSMHGSCRLDVACSFISYSNMRMLLLENIRIYIYCVTSRRIWGVCLASWAASIGIFWKYSKTYGSWNFTSLYLNFIF